MLYVWMLMGFVLASKIRMLLGGAQLWHGWGDRLLGTAGAIIGGYSLALLDSHSGLGQVSTLATALLGAASMLWLSNFARTPLSRQRGFMAAQWTEARAHTEHSDTSWSLSKSGYDE